MVRVLSMETEETYPNPVRRDTDGCSLGSGVQWQNFGHIDPWDAVDRSAENEHVLHSLCQ